MKRILALRPHAGAPGPVADGAGAVTGGEASVARALPVARILWALGMLVLLAHGAFTVFDVGRGRWEWLGGQWTPFTVFAVAAAACVARGLALRREHGAWWALATGLMLYSAGQAYYTLITSRDASPGFPAGSDLLWLSLYPCALVAMVLLARSQRARVRADLWLDGVIAGLTVASLGVVAIFNVVINPAAALHAVPANLAFALGDLLVVGFGIGLCGLLAWRPPVSLVVLIVGFAVLGLQDTAFLAQLLNGTFAPGTFLDSWWLLALLVITAAALPRPARLIARDAKPKALVAFPFVSALIAVGLAAYLGVAAHSNAVSVALTAVTLVTVVVRFALTFRAHLSMLEITEREAVTDALTGLGNRRKLMRDAELALAGASTERPATLAIFDLDGFKAYNDTYGHPAGDVLLARLGDKLARSVAPSGVAYRLGGDEFCVLLVDGDDTDRALAAAAAALHDEGEAFTVSSSYGAVAIPAEANDTTEALRRADQRLYAAKDRRPSAPARQACDTLRQILLASEPELDAHHETVGALAEAVARRLGVHGEALREITRAAELHDIGKIAIPDAILHKPAPLTDDEWQFMRRHTTIGERFLASIPSLLPVARLVRSSHERYDGGGYPDGLSGEDIPLGARIIFACDAYDAMTSDRAYRAGMSPQAAAAELRRNAGAQFDPAVVDALCAELAGQPAAPGRTSPARSEAGARPD